MRRRKREKTIKETINDGLGLTSDILLDLPRIMLSGNRELHIENYKGILEYNDNCIKINSKLSIIEVSGTNLEMITMTDEEILIAGKIKTISFTS